MKSIRFAGPQDYVDILGYGRHLKGEDKEYPPELAEDLLRDERFSESGSVRTAVKQAAPKGTTKKKGK